MRVVGALDALGGACGVTEAAQVADLVYLARGARAVIEAVAAHGKLRAGSSLEALVAQAGESRLAVGIGLAEAAVAALAVGAEGPGTLEGCAISVFGASGFAKTVSKAVAWFAFRACVFV